jgi:hypothetical protein
VLDAFLRSLLLPQRVLALKLQLLRPPLLLDLALYVRLLLALHALLDHLLVAARAFLLLPLELVQLLAALFVAHPAPLLSLLPALLLPHLRLPARDVDQ